EDFRMHSRAKIQEKLLQVSKQSFPAINHHDIDAKINEELSGAQTAEAEDAKSLAEWFKQQTGVEVSVEDLTDMTPAEAREYLWDSFDLTFRPEMRRMERSLLLNQLDTAWKNHL